MATAIKLHFNQHRRITDALPEEKINDDLEVSEVKSAEKLPKKSIKEKHMAPFGEP